jgi:glycosyltransferase involved in cell wall biosynthesis
VISVIVPAYNEEEAIKECLESIKKGTYQDFELITVVGGNDRTFDIASKYGNAFHDNKSKGAGPARNRGAERAKGDILVFTDADGAVNPDWLAKYAEAFKDKRVVAAGGPVRPTNGGIVDKIFFKLNQDWGYRFTAFFRIYQFSGQNCAYRKDVFLKIGGFNEKMSMLEDTELSNRMSKKGKCVHIKDNWVESSPRRFHKKGYLRVLLQFVKNYFVILVLHRLPREAYFASAKK